MKSSLLYEFQEWVIKNGALLMSLGLGVAAKIALDFKSGKKLTPKQLAATFVLSCFIGYLAGVWVEGMGYQRLSKIIAPIATLLGESITMWLVANCGKYLTIFADWFVRNKKQ